MIYGSVCSGIEAATVAWHGLGWEPAWFAEIEPFPCKVLKHHYPGVPNLGDMTKLSEHEKYNDTNIDVLVGGTPCQSFSIAGLRGGMADERGNLALEFCRILIAKLPKWFVWENVPGVFSSFTDVSKGTVEFRGKRWTISAGEIDITKTADFATLLLAFRECGYSVSYRVFDSKYFGVPQRRRRVFVVGHFGEDWRPPAAVLLERDSMRRDFTPSREKRKEVTENVGGRSESYGIPGNWIGRQPGNGGNAVEPMHDLSPCLTKADKHGVATWWDGGNEAATITKCSINQYMPDKGNFPCVLQHMEPVCPPVVYSIMPMNSGKDYKARETDVAQPLMARGPVSGNQGGDYVLQPIVLEDQGGSIMNVNTTGVVGTLRIESHGHEPIIVQPTFFQPKSAMDENWAESEQKNALRSQESKSSHVVVHGTQDPCVSENEAFALGRNNGGENVICSDTADTLTKGANQTTGFASDICIAGHPMVRRLTPLECERLQGFPDNYTNIPGASDGPRYAAIGNSMTTNVMKWIGERIEKVDNILERVKHITTKHF